MRRSRSRAEVSFLREIEAALGNEYKRLLPVICPKLWADVSSYLDRSAIPPDRSMHHQCAVDLKADADRMLAALRRHRRLISQAVDWSYLPGRRASEDMGEDTISLGELGSNKEIWIAARQAEQALRALRRDASGWEAQTRPSAGRPRNLPRLLLSERVALHLHSVNIPLTAYPDGPFARVLAVVQRWAGFGDRSGPDCIRDIRRILSDGSPVAQYLKSRAE